MSDQTHLEKPSLDYLSWRRIQGHDDRRHLTLINYGCYVTACGLSAVITGEHFDDDTLPCEPCLGSISRAMDLAFPE